MSGYNLPALLPENGFDVAKALVGSESTCVMVLGARVRLVPSPPVRRLIVLGFADVSDAADHAAEFVAIDGVIGLEGIDEQLVEDMRLNHIHVDDIDVLPRGQGWLIVEVGARTDEEATAYAEAVRASAARLPDPPSVRIVSDQTEQERLWKVREAGLGATARVPGQRDGWPGWEDSSVPPERLGDYVRELRKLFDRYGYDASLYGHFGQGCVHCRITFDLESAPGIEQWRSFLHDAARLVTAFGGSLSGEHGDGQQRAELLPIMFGDELVEAFRAFKAIWDPHGRMNPGKIVDARPLTADLRLGAEFAPERPKTHFAFRDDDRDFTRATLRCVGIGNCRQEGHGTMCPSYMVTHEEKHSTRGRARLLFEMMEGRTLEDGWRDDSVREALDLCLSCKGCKGECPVHVDMATYKAEFLAHYYRGRLRPRTAYAIGQVMYAARLGSRLPRLANAVTQSRLLGPIVKRIGGVAPQRDIPRLAALPFDEWFRSRPARAVAPRGEVLLWVDTWNNYFTPEIGRAAVGVLEHGGYRVSNPATPALLRPAALRLRLPEAGPPLSRAHARQRARRRTQRRTARRPRTELRVGVPRRAHRHARPLTRREPAEQPDRDLGRVPREQRRAGPARRRQGARARTLPPQVGARLRRRRAGHAARGGRRRGRRIGVLRHGRLVRIRGRALRRLDRVRRTRRCSPRCAGPTPAR